MFSLILKKKGIISLSLNTIIIVMGKKYEIRLDCIKLKSYGLNVNRKDIHVCSGLCLPYIRLKLHLK